MGGVGIGGVSMGGVGIGGVGIGGVGIGGVGIGGIGGTTPAGAWKFRWGNPCTSTLRTVLFPRGRITQARV